MKKDLLKNITDKEDKKGENNYVNEQCRNKLG